MIVRRILQLVVAMTFIYAAVVRAELDTEKNAALNNAPMSTAAPDENEELTLLNSRLKALEKKVNNISQNKVALQAEADLRRQLGTLVEHSDSVESRLAADARLREQQMTLFEQAIGKINTLETKSFEVVSMVDEAVARDVSLAVTTWSVVLSLGLSIVVPLVIASGGYLVHEIVMRKMEKQLESDHKARLEDETKIFRATTARQNLLLGYYYWHDYLNHKPKKPQDAGLYLERAIALTTRGINM